VAFLCASFWLMAQEVESQEQVLRLLKADQPQLPANPEALLCAGKWEALAYWSQEAAAGDTGLQEAVPDWYTFLTDDTFEIMLVDARNAGQVRQVISGHWWLAQGLVRVVPLGAKEVKGSWQIWYLDEHYLVLEMEGLRVFFVHPEIGR